LRSIPVIANTVVATILTCIGFGLILSAGIQLRNTNITAKQGAVWGIFAFMAFILAPSFGLPPELPGSGADTVHGRQGWWFLTVLLTIFGLWNLVFKEKLINIVIGVFLIALPPYYWFTTSRSLHWASSRRNYQLILLVFLLVYL